MKVRVMLKNPDIDMDLSQEEYDAVKPLLDKYLTFGELVTIEFDTEKGTAEVIPAES